jgi:hypothetical protein
MKLHARLKYEDFWKPARALKTLKNVLVVAFFVLQER